MLKFLIEAFKASKGRMPNNMEMILLKQKAAKQSVDERKVVSMFDRSAVNPNKPILGGKNIPETEEDIRQRLLKNNEKGLASMKSKLEDPEKKADGGRIGLFKGAQADTKKGKSMSPGTSTTGSVRNDNPFTGGGGDGNNNPPPVSTKNTTPDITFFNKTSKSGLMNNISPSILTRLAKIKEGYKGLKPVIKGDEIGLEYLNEDELRDALTNFSITQDFKNLIETKKVNPEFKFQRNIGDFKLKGGIDTDKNIGLELSMPFNFGKSKSGNFKNRLSPDTSKFNFEDMTGIPSQAPANMQMADVSAADINRLIDPVSNKPKYSSSQDVDDIKMFEDAAGFEFNPTMTDQEIKDVLDKKITRPTGQFAADGGRIGYKVGTGKKGVEGLIDLIKNKFGKKSITTADKAPIPPKTLERDMFKKADENFKNKRMLTDDEYQDFLDEVGGADQLEAYDFDGTVGDAKRIIKEQKQYMDDMELEYKKGNLDPGPGEKGRKEFLQKKLDEVEASGDQRLMTVDEIEELSSLDSDSQMDVVKTLAPKMVERLQLKKKYPGITDDLLDKILIDDKVQRKAEVLATIDEAFKMMEKGKGTDEILDTMKNVTRTKQADGGITRIGLKGGSSITDKIVSMLGGKNMAAGELGFEGLNQIYQLLSMPGLYADGGRIGYKAGSVDKMRRLFLKAIGAGTAGVGAAKSGIFSFGKGAGKEVAKEVVQKSTTTPPPYFFKLAEKIKMLGDDATATTDRTIAKTLKSKDGKSTYVLEEDVATGDTIIKKVNKEGDEMITDVEIMEFKKGEVVPGKDGKAIKTPDEYEEVTEANARIEGDVFNDPYYTDGIQIDEIMKEVGEQAPSIKKAGGGIARMLGE
jgi:hypothetical protein